MSADADEQAFLAAVAAQPDDDTARLVYADWLDEHDQALRAEVIRRGVKRPKRFTFAPGAPAVVSYATDRRDLPRVVEVTLARGYPGVTWTTHKGLVEYASCAWGAWCDVADALVAAEWLPEVCITTRPNLLVAREASWVMVPGRRVLHRLEPGDDPRRVALAGEWPPVKRWALPEPLRLVPPEGERVYRSYTMAHPPEIGDTVTMPDGSTGVLMGEVDEHGWALVRRVQA